MNNLSSYDVNKNGYIHRDKPEITSFNEIICPCIKNANFLKSIISSRTNKICQNRFLMWLEIRPYFIQISQLK